MKGKQNPARTGFAACTMFAVLMGSAAADSNILPDVPDGVQAISLLGKPLVSSQADADTLDKLQAAKKDYDRDPADADNIIWYGRRLAYAGDYREAIRVFTQGINRHAEDARMYRHR
ncbi:MAG TPA: hypothetical protein VMO24_08795, partial [Woeseiaceae bacterium]|nr:hypothetical protein [Woeseiaceae bacterium]